MNENTESKVKTLTAAEFTKQLESYKSPVELKKYEKFFKFSDDKPLKNDRFIGVRMGKIFNLAKEYMDMELEEIEKLLNSPIHEVRVGAVSIMDYQARSRKSSVKQREELFNLYLRRHDRINTWDLVDRSVIYVVGSYLYDFKKPRDVLYKLAKSKVPMERRSAIVSTAYFIKHGEVEDTFKIAEILLNDKEDLIHKGAGWMLRTAGVKDRDKLIKFLNQYASSMPRVMLRYSIEHLDKKQKEIYIKMKE